MYGLGMYILIWFNLLIYKKIKFVMKKWKIINDNYFLYYFVGFELIVFKFMNVFIESVEIRKLFICILNWC